MISICANALRNIHARRDTDRQWKIAVDAMAQLSACERTEVWLALLAQHCEPTDIALSATLLAELKMVYKRALKAVELPVTQHNGSDDIRELVRGIHAKLDLYLEQNQQGIHPIEHHTRQETTYSSDVKPGVTSGSDEKPSATDGSDVKKGVIPQKTDGSDVIPQTTDGSDVITQTTDGSNVTPQSVWVAEYRKMAAALFYSNEKIQKLEEAHSYSDERIGFLSGELKKKSKELKELKKLLLRQESTILSQLDHRDPGRILTETDR